MDINSNAFELQKHLYSVFLSIYLEVPEALTFMILSAHTGHTHRKNKKRVNVQTTRTQITLSEVGKGHFNVS